MLIDLLERQVLWFHEWLSREKPAVRQRAGASGTTPAG